MSVLWVVPLAVLAIGLVLAAIAVRRGATAVIALRAEAGRLAEVSDRLATVDHGMRRVQTRAQELRSRVPGGRPIRRSPPPPLP